MESKTTQQHQARVLYLQTELSQQQIADALNINRKTLYLWMKEGHWKRAKCAAASAPTMLAEQYYHQLAMINKSIAARSERPYPTKEESDIIRRLTATLKQLPTKHLASETIEVFTLFIDKLRRENNILAQTVLPYIDKHIDYLFERSQGATDVQDTHFEDEDEKEYKQWLAGESQANLILDPEDLKAEEIKAAAAIPIGFSVPPNVQKTTCKPPSHRSNNGATNGAMPPPSKPTKPASTLSNYQNYESELSTKKIKNEAIDPYDIIPPLWREMNRHPDRYPVKGWGQ